MKVTGKVVKGEGRGRGLGWPTANLVISNQLAAKDGVYAARVEVGGADGKQYNAMAYLGAKPTFKGTAPAPRVLELHLFDFEGDLYGRPITAELKKFIRKEQKFATSEALRTQIAKDQKTIKTILRCT